MKEDLTRVNIVDRLFETTPVFWKKMRRLGLAIGVISGAIISIPASAGLALPLALITIAKVAAVVGTTTVGLATLTSTERK